MLIAVTSIALDRRRRLRVERMLASHHRALALAVVPAPYTPPMRRNLSGMVVVITGASAGIGKALAKTLAGRGVRLALAARRSDRLEVLNAQLGGSHLCVTTD